MNSMIPVRLHKLQDDTIECFTHFRMQDKICREFCAVRLRCLVEQQQRLFPEMMDDDFFLSDEMYSDGQ